MKTAFLCVTVAVALADVVFGQARPGSGQPIVMSNQVSVVNSPEVRAIDMQLAQLRRAAMQSPEGQASRQAMVDAEKAYRAAETNLPAVRAVDAQIAALRVQMSDLMRQRQALVQTNAPALAVQRQARDQAQAEFQAVMTGGAQGQALLQQRQALIQAAATRQLQSPVPATPTSP